MVPLLAAPQAIDQATRLAEDDADVLHVAGQRQRRVREDQQLDAYRRRRRRVNTRRRL